LDGHKVNPTLCFVTSIAWAKPAALSELAHWPTEVASSFVGLKIEGESDGFPCSLPS
jgi:hypothetical protein